MELSPHPVNIRRPGRRAGTWACALLGLLVLAGTLIETAFAAPGRYLFIVETSRTMQRRSEGMVQAVKGLLDTQFDGRMRPGDTLHLLTFNERVYSGPFGLDPQQFVEHLKLQMYESRPIIDKIFPEINRLVAESNSVTVVLFSSGEGRLQGTPFDAEINGEHERWRDQQQRARMPIVTVLQAHNGAIYDWAVTPAPRKIALQGGPAKPMVIEKRDTPAEVLEALRSALTNQPVAAEEPKPESPPAQKAKAPEKKRQQFADIDPVTGTLNVPPPEPAEKPRPAKAEPAVTTPPTPPATRPDKRFADPSALLAGNTAPANTAPVQIANAAPAQPETAKAGTNEAVVAVATVPPAQTNATVVSTEKTQPAAEPVKPATVAAIAPPETSPAKTPEPKEEPQPARTEQPMPETAPAQPVVVTPPTPPVTVPVPETQPAVEAAAVPKPSDPAPATAAPANTQPTVPEPSANPQPAAQPMVAVPQPEPEAVQPPPQISPKAERRQPAPEPAPAPQPTSLAQVPTAPSAPEAAPSARNATLGKVLRENAVWLVLLFMTGMGASYCFFMWLQTYLKPRIKAPATSDFQGFEAYGSTQPTIAATKAAAPAPAPPAPSSKAEAPTGK